MRGTDTRSPTEPQPQKEVVVGASASTASKPGLGAAIAMLVALIAIGAILTRATRLGENVDPEFEPAAIAVTTVPSPPAEWLVWDSALTPIPQLQAQNLVAVDTGFAVLAGPGEGTGAWTSTDGLLWTPLAMDILPFGLVTDGTGLLAFRGETMWRITQTGTRWAVQDPVTLPTWARLGYLSDRPAVTATAERILLQSVDGELFAGDDTGFNEVIEAGIWSTVIEDPWEAATGPRRPQSCRPPTSGSIDYAPIVATDHGFYAFVAGGEGRHHGIWPACRPRVWTSPDGLEWSVVTRETPFALGAYVYDVAWRDGTFIAVGGVGAERAALWTSTDGHTWSRQPIRMLPTDTPFQPTAIESGPLGWVILGVSNDHSTMVGWASPDGTCWLPLPDEVVGAHAAVGTDALAVVDRAGAMWVGTPNSEPGC